MMTLEYAEGFAEQVDLVESFRLLGFDAAVREVSVCLEGKALEEITCAGLPPIASTEQCSPYPRSVSESSGLSGPSLW
jgi:hypothetical protein